MNIEERNRVFEENIGLLYSVVNDVYRDVSTICNENYADIKDLEQVGAIAMLEAIPKYDKDRGTAFSTYIVPIVRWKILDWVNERATIVKLPRLGSVKDPGTQRQVSNIRFRNSVASLEKKTIHADGGSKTLGESIPVIDNGVEKVLDLIDLEIGLKALEGIERYCINEMYYKEVPQRRIGEALGYDQSKVSRTITSGIIRMREKLGVVI